MVYQILFQYGRSVHIVIFMMISNAKVFDSNPVLVLLEHLEQVPSNFLRKKLGKIN